MIHLRPYSSLGGFDYGWLNTKHHFSFGNYLDANRMGWGALRVINDDTLAPQTGFPPHPHKDMEIITIVLQGAISHKDSLGHTGRTAAQEFQVMTAGTGIFHEEFNQENIPTKIFQIWIQPRTLGLSPRWASRALAAPESGDGFVTLACGQEHNEHILQLNADASIRRAQMTQDAQLHYAASSNRRIYVLLASGHVAVNGEVMQTGDGLAARDEKVLKFHALKASEVLLIDVAA